MTDVTILTDRRYYAPKEINPYIANILEEYRLLKEALEAEGLTVKRINWDDPDYDFSATRAVVFRTVWDYFERFDEFFPWLKKLDTKTRLINPLSLIEWNIDKHYLADLGQKGFPVVPTVFVNKGQNVSLISAARKNGWGNVVIKPAISGAAFETYRVSTQDMADHEGLFAKLLSERDMLIQPFIDTITSRGEASLMVFGGTFTHAILKRAKQGDFRVQDDFGGSVHPYKPTACEIDLAEKVFSSINPNPVYGRLDIVWDEDDQAMISELEIIEPELWLRKHPPAATVFARAVKKELSA